ncbi:hypothetical protein [Acidicapsa acidisoli]|uniref:hypothetical protein n=1 Tax=Acidicapsa acidisoli TaxID=1615681 RepID=UPI0021DFE683|nr:hypothetical protein [Acidicapsa acidisoli]
MSMTPAFVPEASEPTLFDSLARLVPVDLQAAYYRVLAHTRELSPDDEMLRILEAMGVLALLTRGTPLAMAEERERMEKVLAHYEHCAQETQEKMLTHRNGLEARIALLPKEVERSLNPSELARFLGESLRQQFLQTGLPKTAEALQASTEMMVGAQEILSAAIDKLCDHRYGVLAQVESANRLFGHSLERWAKKIDDLLLEVRHDILRTWIPMICAATLVVGLVCGAGIQSWRDTQSSDASVSPPVAAQVDAVPKSKNPSVSNHGKLNPPTKSGSLRSVGP